MAKRTDNIYAVTIAKYATMYVEAESSEEAVNYAKEHCDELDDDEFWDSDNAVDSYEDYSSESEEYMKKIWTENGVKTYDQYVDELNEQED